MWSAVTMPELPIHEIDLAPFRTGSPADRAAVAAAFDRAGRGSGFILLTGHGVDPCAGRRRVRRVAGVLRPAARGEAPRSRAARVRRADRLHRVRRAGPRVHRRRRVAARPDGGVLDRTGGHDRSVLRRRTATGSRPTCGPTARASLRAAVDALELRAARRGRRRAARDGARARPPRGVAGRAGRARGRHDPLQPLPARCRVRTAARPARARRPHRLRHGHAARRRPGARAAGAARRRVARRDPAAGSIVCNLGDMLAMWTNDRWVSTMHRVLPPTPGDGVARRRSIARFLDGDPSVTLAAIPSCVATGRRRATRRCKAGEWLMAEDRRRPDRAARRAARRRA